MRKASPKGVRMTVREAIGTFGIFVSPKTDCRSDADQLEFKRGFIEDKQKPPREFLASLRGFT